MRIGFDGKRAVQNNTGLGNYSRYLLEILSKIYPQNEYHVYAPKNKENSRLQKIKQSANIHFHYPQSFFSKLFSSLWRVRYIKKDLQRDGIEIFHGLSNEIPVGMEKANLKTVVSLHDLIFLRYPELYKPIDRKIYHRKFKYACQKSDIVIAISECTKRDIVSFFGVDPQKIKVVYQGCDKVFSEKVTDRFKDEIKTKYSLPAKYLLFVGSIETRKNLLLVIKSLTQVDEKIHLVAVGKSTPYMEILRKYIVENNLEHRVHFFHQITFAELPVFYQMAHAFVYPSLFEGFGIPIIEALSSQIPVIAATGSCLEEAGGKGAIYVDPLDSDAVAEAITKLYNDEELYKELVRAGQIHLNNFSEETIAKDLIDIYRECQDAVSK